MLYLRAWNSIGRILAAAVAVASLQACANAGSPESGTAALPSLNARERAQELVRGFSEPGQPTAIYIANALNNVVDVFGFDRKLTGTITDGVTNPSGLFVDGNQNLWVSNSTTISMYPKGQTAPSRTLEDPNGSADDICVTRNGWVYVTNFFNGTLSVYAPGSNTTTTTLTDPHAQYIVGVATTTAGDVYVTGNDSTGVGYLAEFVGGKQSGYKRLSPRFSWGADIKLDRAGNLLVLDSQQYRVSGFTQAGRPTGLSFFTKQWWNAFDISRDGKYIVGTQQLADQDDGVLRGFPGHKLLGYFRNNFGGGISGIAIAPGRFCQ